MNCQHCGAPLPPIAMFCGECGRSVSAPPPPPVRAIPDDEPVGVSVSAPVTVPGVYGHQHASVASASPASPQSSAEAPAASCPECGTRAEPADRYCAECGTDLSSDTRVVEPIMREQAVPEGEQEPTPASASAPESASAPDSAPAPEPTPESVPTPESASAPESAPEPSSPQSLHPAPPPVFPSQPEPLPDRTPGHPDGSGQRAAPVRPTLPTQPAPPVEHRFVLQFSTGESYAVLGTGLAGRNPRPEPGEVVDHVVTIVDPGRSVSKTHFEFGHDDGIFWVTDRHSGNGSVIREPGRPPRYCEPGHRYHVARGTRLDIGEQFVIIS